MEQRVGYVVGAIDLPLGGAFGGKARIASEPEVEVEVEAEFRDLSATVPGGDSVAHPDRAPGPFGRTLRIALAMKGGVSLAVWIGGAVTELDVLRRIRLTGDPSNPGARLLATWPGGEDVLTTHRDLIRRATAYAKLLASRGYDSVEFDVLAGASAGGLNAVMYGVAQRVGATTDQILETWQSSGDIWKLLRGGGWRSVDSVLRGDDYFWGVMLEALKQLYEAPHHSGLVAPVSVDLSATVIDGEESTERGTREGKAHFHFSGGTQTDLPGRIIPELGCPEPDREVALTRLAYAARTTSSFPGAFEPAKIYSGDVSAPPGAVDMRDAFHAHRPERPRLGADNKSATNTALDPFRVVDGGVTDNVPIDRALRAIRNRPADHYVNRALIYLDPSPKLEFDGLIRPIAYHGRPPSLGETRSDSAADKADARSAFLSVVFTSLGHMLGRESKDDEVEDVERFRRLLYLEQAKDELFAPITEEPISRPGGGQPDYVARAYARFRSGADLDLLTEVLVQPSLWQLMTREARGQHRGWRREDLIRLEGVLFGRLGSLDSGGLEGVCTGPQAVVDACRCMIAWMRAIEDGAFWNKGGIAALDGVVWVAAKAGRTRTELRRRLHEELTAALRDRDAAIMSVVAAADAYVPAEDSDGPRLLAGTIVDAWLEHGNKCPKGSSPWDRLNPLVEDLRAVSVALDDYDDNSPARVKARPGRQHDTDWSQSPWSGIGRTPPTFLARDLAPLVAARGIPMAMPAMRYEDITAAETVRNPASYRSLMQAQMIDGYRSLLKLSVKDAKQLALTKDGNPNPVSISVRRLMPTGRIRPRTKLAGMNVANFAGFLSGDWRTNDWWWGRLDAAQGAIDVFETLTPFTPEEGGTSPESVVASPATADDPRGDVEAAILDDWRGAEDANDTVGREAFKSELGTNVGGLGSLEPSYKVALASRLLRLLSQAVVRGTSVFALQRISLWLLRPLLVFAPALLQPARVAVVGALITAPVLLALPVSRTAEASDWILALLLAGFSAAVIVISFAERIQRTDALQNALDEERLGSVREAVRKAGLEGTAYVAATFILSLGALRMVGDTGAVEPITWVLLGAAVVLSLIARSRFLVPTVPSGRSPVGSTVGFALAALIVVIAWLQRGSLFVPDDDPEPWLLALLASLTGAAVAVVLTIGWLFGRARQIHRSQKAGIPPRLAGLGVLALTAVLSGIAAGTVFLIPSVGQWSWVSLGVPALIAFWLWGTTLWWIPARLQPDYAPNDTPAHRDPPRERRVSRATR